MKNFYCKKCGTFIVRDSQPSTSGCPKASVHQWINMGESGNTEYQCKKCGMLVRSKSWPSTSGCPKASVHQWYKL